MTVLDVLKITCRNLGLEEFLSLTEFGGNEVATDEQALQIEQLIACINDVNQSIAYMYLPLKTIENITINNKKFEYSKFAKTLIEILWIKNASGLKQKHTCFPTFLSCENGSYTVNYTYAPSFVNNVNDVLDVHFKIDARTMAYGVTSRYYLLKGLFSEANAWDIRFQQSLLVASRRNSNIRMYDRGWL